MIIRLFNVEARKNVRYDKKQRKFKFKINQDQLINNEIMIKIYLFKILHTF